MSLYHQAILSIIHFHVASLAAATRMGATLFFFLAVIFIIFGIFCARHLFWGKKESPHGVRDCTLRCWPAWLLRYPWTRTAWIFASCTVLLFVVLLLL